MAERSLRDAFEVLLDRSTPTSSERDAAVQHRASVEGALRAALDVNVIRETGSFTHGTGVRGYSDVDILVSLKDLRPASSDTALRWVKEALNARFPYTEIRISRPAVVINFAGGAERWEIIPGFVREFVGDTTVYDIPGPSDGWIQSAPQAHLAYVTDANRSPSGGAKKLARLLKRWKYANKEGFKASSFYLEMRAAAYMSTESHFLPDMDFERVMSRLAGSNLAAMNDPMRVSGRIEATSSATNHAAAVSRIAADSRRVTEALELEKNGDRAGAFEGMNYVFLGSFPSRFL